MNKTEFLKNFFDLSTEILESISNDLIPLSLEPGEKLCDFNQDFPGLFFILKGKLRLLEKNNSGDIFTLKTFSEGKYIGGIQLLRGVLDHSVAASDNVHGLLFPANKFFKLIMREKDFLNSFSLVDSIEFCSSLKNNRDFQKFESKTLLNWLEKELSNSIKIINADPGENYLNQNQGKLMISSSNIDELSSGYFLNSPVQFKVKGAIPARLIPISLDLQNKLNSFQEKFIRNIY